MVRVISEILMEIILQLSDTGSKIDRIGEFLLDGIHEYTVDFRDNYDGSEKEPKYSTAFQFPS